MANSVTNLTTLKINYLTAEQYAAAIAGGQINENELYMTPAAQGTTNVTVTDTLATGTKIATITVDDTDYDIYAPSQVVESDPVFAASVAASITSTDIANWNAKISDDKTWNGVTLSKSTTSSRGTYYIPVLSSTTGTAAYLYTATSAPTANAIVKYDNNKYLTSTTPTAGDNSTKVATTAFVTAAIPDSTSDLTNDSHFITLTDVANAGYITEADIPEGAARSSAIPLPDAGTGSAGTSNAFARGDHVHPVSGISLVEGDNITLTESSTSLTIAATVPDVSDFITGGTVSQPTFTGSSSNVTITATASNSGNYTPQGSISGMTFSGNALTSTGKFTPAGSISVSKSGAQYTVSKASSGTATYTPEGTVSQPTFSGTRGSVSVSGKPTGSVTIGTGTGTANYTPAGTVTVTPSTTTVNSITAVGTLPALTFAINGTDEHQLDISWSAGTLPTKGSNTTVATGIQSAGFSGTGVQLTGSFSGTNFTSTGTFTPRGTVSQPSFTGTGARLLTASISTATGSGSFTGTEGNVSVSGTPTGNITGGTFTGTKVQLSGTTTAAGTVSQPTFTGTKN